MPAQADCRLVDRFDAYPTTANVIALVEGRIVGSRALHRAYAGRHLGGRVLRLPGLPAPGGTRLHGVAMLVLERAHRCHAAPGVLDAWHGRPLGDRAWRDPHPRAYESRAPRGVAAQRLPDRGRRVPRRAQGAARAADDPRPRGSRGSRARVPAPPADRSLAAVLRAPVPRRRRACRAPWRRRRCCLRDRRRPRLRARLPGRVTPRAWPRRPLGELALLATCPRTADAGGTDGARPDGARP